MRSILHAVMCLTVAIAACTGDPAVDPGMATADRDNTAADETDHLAAASQSSTQADAARSSSQDATTAVTAGCAHVVWCDQPGATGTVCHQDGCSVSAAKSECISDLGAIGCSLHCPAYLELSGGGRSCICSAPGTCTPGCPC